MATVPVPAAAVAPAGHQRQAAARLEATITTAATIGHVNAARARRGALTR
jgi:hypothetical protein